MQSRHVLVGLMLLLLLTVGLRMGCAPAQHQLPKTVPVSGTVTYHNKPVPFGMIVLHPVDAGIQNAGRLPMGQISQGAFRLTTFNLNDGAIPARYRAIVDCREGGPTPENPRAKTNWIVPELYAEAKTSPLEVEITLETKEIHLDF